MFDLKKFIEDCAAAVESDPTHHAVCERMKNAFADPRGVMKALGEPSSGCLSPLYEADDLTILNVVWNPGMSVIPHDHRTWAVIGVYLGQEDNVFWRRVKGDAACRIERASTQSLHAGDVLPLGRDIIHSVRNPSNSLTGAIHIYGGRFFALERSGWDTDELTERPYDMGETRASFSAA